ncbi:hypothetical protein [Halalkalibacter urbisdiaboli]|uniref:hypothetical protein n=1 Tax=Halalkalibacter urbisdiaboli TaxID=1960589 RepID=UPI000B44D472|nr:hypothetical protein [Halalkalibacter urbisdiaboli]
MRNFNPTNKARRFKAYISAIGTTQLHLHNPYIVAWWSAAFPGFGHMLIAKNLRGFTLFLWEILINNMTNLNLSMVYSFTGNIEMAKAVLEPRWFLLYIPVYLFAIWDSYRTAVNINSEYILAEREQASFPTYSIGAWEINYLDKRKPTMAVMWSLFTPGLGQLYSHQIFKSFFIIFWVVIFVYFSNVLVAIHYLFFGEVTLATQALNPQWLLFIPSHIGFAAYDSYVNTVETNKLFDTEQKNYLIKNYQQYRVKLSKRT